MKSNKFKYGICNDFTAEGFATNNRQVFLKTLNRLVCDIEQAGNKPKITIKSFQAVKSIDAVFELLARIEEDD